MDNSLVYNLIYFSNRSVSCCDEIDEKIIFYYDLTFVLEGTMTYVIDNKTYIINKNEALFLKPGASRKRIANNKPTRYVSFNFEMPAYTSLEFDTVITHAVTSTIKKLLTIYPFVTIQSSFHSKEKITNILNCILYELIDLTEIKSSNEHVIKIYKYIANNLDKKITLDIISEKLHLSKEHISRIFKKETNKTVTEYITEQKMLYAKELILSQNMSLPAVASLLKYDDYCYFSRLFKKQFNISPGILKKNSLLM